MPYSIDEKQKAWDEIDQISNDLGLTMQQIVLHDPMRVPGMNAAVGRLCLKCFIVRSIHDGQFCNVCGSDEYHTVLLEDFFK